MDFLLDPKKLIPGLSDSSHREELPTGSALLVEMVSAEGHPPDAIAGELQRRQLIQELLILLPAVVVMYSGGWIPWKVKNIFLALYLYGFWPATGLRLAWSPLRARRPETWRETARDTFFVAAAFMQGLFIALPAGLLFYAGAETLLQALGVSHWAREMLAALPAWFLVGPYVANRCMAASLAERELEDEVLEALPPGELEETARALSPVSLWAGRLRTIFRAAFMGVVGMVPYWVCREMLGMTWSQIPEWVRWSQGLGIALGLHQLARAFFYAAMAERTQRLIAERAAALPEPEAPVPLLEEGASPGRGESALVPSERSLAPMPARPDELAWRHLRQGEEVRRALIYSMGIAVGAMGLKTLGAPVAVMLGLGFTVLGFAVADRASRRTPDEVAPPLRAAFTGAVAGIPAGLLLAGMAALTGEFGSWFGRGPYTALAVFGLSLFTADRATWLWSRWTASLQGRTLPRRLGPDAQVRRAADIWRRSLVAGAGGLAAAFLVISAAELLSGVRLYKLKAFIPLVAMALTYQVGMRSYLYAALGNSEAEPEALPEESGEPEEAGQAA